MRAIGAVRPSVRAVGILCDLVAGGRIDGRERGDLAIGRVSRLHGDVLVAAGAALDVVLDGLRSRGRRRRTGSDPRGPWGRSVATGLAGGVELRRGDQHGVAGWRARLSGRVGAVPPLVP